MRLPLLILVCAILAAVLWLDMAPETSDTQTTANTVRNTQTASINQIPSPVIAKDVLLPGKLNQSGNPLSSMRLNALTETTKRPLFISTRRQPAAPKRTVRRIARVQQPVASKPTYTLVGVIKEGRGSYALLKDRQNGRSYRVGDGDIVGEWNVISIQIDTITLSSQDGRNFKLKMPGK